MPANQPNTLDEKPLDDLEHSPKDEKIVETKEFVIEVTEPLTDEESLDMLEED